MKKITFVEKDDDSSYDPVTTFFGAKQIPASLKPPSRTSSSVTSKVVDRKRQIDQTKMNRNQQQPHKIGQKKGSGYLPKRSEPEEKILPNENINGIIERQESSSNSKQVEDKIEKPLSDQQSSDIDNYVSQENAKQKNSQKEGQKLDPKKEKTQKAFPSIKSSQAVQRDYSTEKLEFGSSRKSQFKKINKQQTQNRKADQKLSSDNQNLKKTESTQAKSKKFTKQETQKNSNRQLELKSPNSLEKLKERISELSLREEQYERKIADLEVKNAQLVKTEQKFQRVSKEHRQCSELSREVQVLKEELTFKEQTIKQLMATDKVPFSRKREHLIQNQISQLKKQNRNLALRLKNYRGADIVQVAAQRNMGEICREFEVQEQDGHPNFSAEVESTEAALVDLLQNYLARKTASKGFCSFIDEQKFLTSLIQKSQKISLFSLQKYGTSPLSRSSTDCRNLYAEIEQNRECHPFNSSMGDIIKAEDLNFAISQTNIQTLNCLNKNSMQIDSQLQSLNFLNKQRGGKASGYARKATEVVQTCKSTSHFLTLCLVQSVCYFTFLKEWVTKKFQELQTNLSTFSQKLEQLKEVFEVSDSKQQTKQQALKFYLQNNLQDLVLRVPDLQFQIKEIKLSYQGLFEGSSRQLTNPKPSLKN